MKVPFVDLGTQYKSIKQDVLAAVDDVFSGSRFILSRDVSEFENDFAAYLGTKFTVGVASGTDALHLALKALDVGPGDEVITAANTFIATTLAISQTGATTVLADCMPDSYNIDPAAVERAITRKTKVIIPVHLYGQPVEIDRIMQIARARGIKVVEDTCQSHGAYFKGKRAGTFGDIGCYSFYPGKNLGAYGDGGAVSTDSPELAARLKMLRDYGQAEKYKHEFKGYNSRLDGVQAAILKIKLRKLDGWNKQRFTNAALYSKLLAGVPGVVTPKICVAHDPASAGVPHVFHLYVVRVPQRDIVKDLLGKNEIQTGIHYPIPIHLQKAYSELGLGKGSFPVTEKYAGEILSLPMFPELTEEQIRFVCDKLAEAVKTVS